MTSDGLGVRDSHPDKDVGHLHLIVLSRMALWPIGLIQEAAAAGARTYAYCCRLEYVAIFAPFLMAVRSGGLYSDCEC